MESIEQIVLAERWSAVFEDMRSKPLVCWALVSSQKPGEERPIRRVVGMVTDGTSITRADTLPGFRSYQHDD